MAQAKTDDKKKDSPAKKPKPASTPAAKTSAAAGDGAKAAKAARGKATPPVSDGPTCRVEGCKQGVRAKGFCRKHFMGWRRGAVGDHHRYKTCSKEGCRKPRAKAGFCEEHAGIAAPAAAEAAPAA